MQSVFKWTFSILMFKSPITVKFSYLLERWLRILISLLVNSRSLITGGLYVPTKSHFHFIWWNSKPIISMFGSKSWVFNGLRRIPSWAYNIRSSPYLLRSHLKTVYMKLIQFRFRYKKYIEIFNKLGKHFIFVSKGIDIKVTYYYSAWIPQSLNKTYHLKKESL